VLRLFEQEAGLIWSNFMSLGEQGVTFLLLAVGGKVFGQIDDSPNLPGREFEGSPEVRLSRPIIFAFIGDLG
jgi:hypothetical protein